MRARPVLGDKIDKERMRGALPGLRRRRHERLRAGGRVPAQVVLATVYRCYRGPSAV